MPLKYAPGEAVVHGTRKAYEAAKCRCADCRAANTARCVQYKDARKRAQAKWRDANPEHIAASNRAYRTTVTGKAARRRSNHKRRRGIEYAPDAIAHITALMGDPCAYCGESTDITIDHITPVANGGDSDWSNLTAACAGCNSTKRTRSLLMYLLIKD